ncbi:MAG TPA: hypothetical protein VFI13_09375 [Gemmatimonadales bacterium]|nr:hypothetical protein [Gemmatimonadales bacterium]
MLRRLSLASLILFATPLSAQTAEEPWRDSFYPIISYSGNDGVSLAVRYAWNKRAPWQAPYFYAGRVVLDAGVSASGSYLGSVWFHAPGLRPGWRLDAVATATQQARYEYYGLGEATRYHADSVFSTQQYYYKMRRTQQQLRAELSRRLAGHLWLTGTARYARTTFNDLPGPSLYEADFADGRLETDATARAGLVFDSRENDYDTHHGVLLDAAVLKGTFGAGYQRWMVEGRAWIPFGEWRSTWLALRGVASAASGDVPLDARLYLPVFEGNVRVLGGAESHRGMLDQRFVGRDLLFGNLTLHHDLVNAGGVMAAGLIAFADAGRVFEQEKFSLTTTGMKVGGGGGFYLRLMQTGVYTFNFGEGPDGFVFTLGNSWMF